jgi:hypothetical protein
VHMQERTDEKKVTAVARHSSTLPYGLGESRKDGCSAFEKSENELCLITYVLDSALTGAINCFFECFVGCYAKVTKSEKRREKKGRIVKARASTGFGASYCCMASKKTERENTKPKMSSKSFTDLGVEDSNELLCTSSCLPGQLWYAALPLPLQLARSPPCAPCLLVTPLPPRLLDTLLHPLPPRHPLASSPPHRPN